MAKKKDNTIKDIMDLFSDNDELSRVFKKLFTEAFNGSDDVDLPIIYGMNVRVDDSGKPVIEQFGNVKNIAKPTEISEEREPLIDVINNENEVVVIAEVPGVEKNDIKIFTTATVLKISARSKDRKYYKRVKLPAGVGFEGAVAKYTNGILEITLKKSKSQAGEKEIKVI